MPVAVVKQQKFSRIVTADGYLRAVRATAVVVPMDADWWMRVTWLVADGSVVKKGEPLVRFDGVEITEHKSDAELDHKANLVRREREATLQDATHRDRLRNQQAAARDLAALRTFQRKDSALFARDQIIEDELDSHLKEVEADVATKAALVDQRLGKEKLALLDVEVKKTQEEIRRAEKGLRSLLISAPHDGVFVLRQNRGEPLAVGDTVRRSQSLADVAVIDKMEAEVFVLEAEAAGLLEGRQAELTIEAQPDRRFAGKVKQVDKVVKSRQGKDPTQYFGVVLSLDQTVPELMKPGQRVQARLFLLEQEALVAPRPALFERDGRFVVYRFGKEGVFVPVTVTLGPSTAGLVTIESGLRAGDLIALRDPGKPSPTLKAATGPSTAMPHE